MDELMTEVSKSVKKYKIYQNQGFQEVHPPHPHRIGPKNLPGGKRFNSF